MSTWCTLFGFNRRKIVAFNKHDMLNIHFPSVSIHRTQYNQNQGIPEG